MKSIPGLSACIITLNEQENLPECLQSLTLAQEIVVVDSGSTDDTRKIARDAGARIFRREFDNYIDQKNFAIEKARGPWILFLDADERIGPALDAEIRALFQKHQDLKSDRGGSSEGKKQFRASLDSRGPADSSWKAGNESGVATLEDQPVGYEIPRSTFYLGRWIRHSGWYPDYTVRLFRKGSGRYEGRTFHEKVKLRGVSGKLRGAILHFSYKNIREHLDVINRYSDLFAAERISMGKGNGVLFSLGKAVVKFLTMYIWKLGLLDGKAGLVIAVLGSYYNFLKYIKVWELKAASNRSPESTMDAPRVPEKRPRGGSARSEAAAPGKKL